MTEKETCESCKYFEDKDVAGLGICALTSERMTCGDECILYKKSDLEEAVLQLVKERDELKEAFFEAYYWLPEHATSKKLMDVFERYQ